MLALAACLGLPVTSFLAIAVTVTGEVHSFESASE